MTDTAVRPKLLDLFCNAGGAAMGYHRAGFDVVGVDIEPQPHYPFEFHQADAIEFLSGDLRSFDAIHASPPCQGYTVMRHAPNTKGAPLLIHGTRTLLQASALPWVIENVEAARCAMHDPILLCGSMFGLGVDGYQLRRHRLFESNLSLTAPKCQHTTPVIGVYGAHVRCRAAAHGGRATRDFIGMDKPSMAKKAMGMDWATMGEMSEAIPPAYTEHLGRQLIEAIATKEVAA